MCWFRAIAATRATTGEEEQITQQAMLVLLDELVEQYRILALEALSDG